MYKNVLASALRNETKTFFVVEPLYFAASHIKDAPDFVCEAGPKSKKHSIYAASLRSHFARIIHASVRSNFENKCPKSQEKVYFCNIIDTNLTQTKSTISQKSPQNPRSRLAPEACRNPKKI